jgi:hypothetical protein
MASGTSNDHHRDAPNLGERMAARLAALSPPEAGVAAFIHEPLAIEPARYWPWSAPIGCVFGLTRWPGGCRSVPDITDTPMVAVQPAPYSEDSVETETGWRLNESAQLAQLVSPAMFASITLRSRHCHGHPSG